MHSPAPRLAAAGLASLLIATFTIGCGGATPTPSPTPSPLPTQAAVPFTLQVLPAMATGFTFPGEKFVFLVRIDGDVADGAVQVSASAAGAEIVPNPASLEPGVVGEVIVVPGPATAETEIAVTITATRGGITREEQRVVPVQPGTDQLKPEADQHLAPFVQWLAANRPELGITPETQWEGVPGAWVLVVNHYLYFSEAWELDLSWHVMIAPDDWSRIDLRKRTTEMAPSLAFEIQSVTAGSAPREIEPPEAAWR